MSGPKCPSRQELADLTLGRVRPELLDTLAEHVEQCLECQETIAALSDHEDTLVAQIRRPPDQDVYGREPECQEAVARAKSLAAAVVGILPSESASPPFHTAQPGAEGPAHLDRLGEYQLLAKLGEGGMGTVYKARQTRLKKIVALKVLPKERTANPRAVARFELEMEAVGQLKHENIVEAHDARDIEGTAVLVMEYVEGNDLAQVLKCVKTLRISDACELVRQTAMGLQYVQEHDLVHRDIKPSNLMLSRRGEVKILDLGLALLGIDQPRSVEMTSSGQPIGTADYIAPEQASDPHSVDIRADIYSLGCTLYKLLTGRSPFSGPQYKTPAEKLVGHLKETPQPVQLLRTDVSVELAAVIERMMAKSPAERFASPAEVAAAMVPFAAGCDLVRVSSEVSAAARDIETLKGDVTATEGNVRDVPGSQPLSLAEGQSAAGRLLASPSRRPRWPALATGGAAAAIVLGIIFLVSNGEGTVKLEFADADAARQCTVSIDGDEIRIERLGEPIRLRAGRHQLRVQHGDLEIEAREFDVLQHGTQVLHVSFEAATAPTPETLRDSFSNLTKALNTPSNWLVEDGEWKIERGLFIGMGVATAKFNGELPDDFCLEFKMNVLEGFRPRVELTGGVLIIDSGNYFGGLSLGGRGLFHYPHGQDMQIKFLSIDGTFHLFINGKTVADTRAFLTGRKHSLRLCSGDQGGNPGKVAWSDFKITPVGKTTPVAVTPSTPETLHDYDRLTKELNNPTNWQFVRGEWKTDNGWLVGSGVAEAKFKGKMPNSYVLEFKMLAVGDCRPRVLTAEGLPVFNGRQFSYGFGRTTQLRISLQKGVFQVIVDGKRLPEIIAGAALTIAQQEAVKKIQSAPLAPEEIARRDIMVEQALAAHPEVRQLEGMIRSKRMEIEDIKMTTLKGENDSRCQNALKQIAVYQKSIDGLKHDLEGPARKEAETELRAQRGARLAATGNPEIKSILELRSGDDEGNPGMASWSDFRIAPVGDTELRPPADNRKPQN